MVEEVCWAEVTACRGRAEVVVVTCDGAGFIAGVFSKYGGFVRWWCGGGVFSDDVVAFLLVVVVILLEVGVICLETATGTFLLTLLGGAVWCMTSWGPPHSGQEGEGAEHPSFLWGAAQRGKAGDLQESMLCSDFWHILQCTGLWVTGMMRTVSHPRTVVLGWKQMDQMSSRPKLHMLPCVLHDLAIYLVFKFWVVSCPKSLLKLFRYAKGEWEAIVGL